MNSGDFRRNFLLAVASVIVAAVLITWVLKAAVMLVFYALAAGATILGAMFLYGKVKRALDGSSRRRER